MDTLESLSARVTELEIKLSFADHQVEELNSALFRQQQHMDAVLNEVRILRQQLIAQQPGEFRSLHDEIPPHY